VFSYTHTHINKYTSKGNDTKAGEIEPEEQIRELLLKLEEAVEPKEHTAAV
jgi:hypothetical protein